MNHQLLTTKQAANLLGVSTAFLDRDRWAGAKIPFVRIGSRTVRYREEDIQRYLNGNVRRNTVVIKGKTAKNKKGRR